MPDGDIPEHRTEVERGVRLARAERHVRGELSGIEHLKQRSRVGDAVATLAAQRVPNGLREARRDARDRAEIGDLVLHRALVDAYKVDRVDQRPPAYEFVEH